MRLTMMAMATDRLGCQFDRGIKWEMVLVEVKVSDGGAARPEESGYIIRIPAIAGIGKIGPN